jgi:hypothetical protein
MAEFNAQIVARGLPAFEHIDYDPAAHPEYAHITVYRFLAYSVCPDITTFWTLYCDNKSNFFYLILN